MDGQQDGGAPRQYSPDGKWWWDGSRWVAMPQARTRRFERPTSRADQVNPEGGGRDDPCGTAHTATDSREVAT